MNDKEIESLKKELRKAESNLGGIEKTQLATVIRLSEELRSIISDIEQAEEREKTAWNPALTTRIKMAKKGFKLSKGLQSFQIEVANEFENGNVPEEEGRRFIKIVKLWDDNKRAEAKKEFEHFERIIESSKHFFTLEEDVKQLERELGREKHRIEKILAEMSEIEKEKIDTEKCSRYEQLLKEMEKLKRFREGYIDSITNMPMSNLLEEIERLSMENYFTQMLSKDEANELKELMRRYPVFRESNASQFCEYIDYNDKKLSHICPETVLFRKVVASKKAFFDYISSLKRSSFLQIDGWDENVFAFFSKNVPQSAGTVRKIMELGIDRASCKDEYEKNTRIQKKKEELSVYSKQGLLDELNRIDKSIQVINAETKNERGLLHSLRSILGR